MGEFRCGTCQRKLGVGVIQQLQIKCPRCGTLNQFVTAKSREPERRRASETKDAHV
ncbi:Com family DNA-binding transcriptional regulator [Pandoraea fibrosis]|uniref:Com family DNA-binding transcriptional regulator n=1 Tax=Pandoraea fibrosis TaxID=1891094 RepID=UPI0012409AA3|nr:Com family DNA-binding transcriptional regulator [Pandoraea fibrosis]